jgi:hypothetical protein
MTRVLRMNAWKGYIPLGNRTDSKSDLREHGDQNEFDRICSLSCCSGQPQSRSLSRNRMSMVRLKQVRRTEIFKTGRVWTCHSLRFVFPLLAFRSVASDRDQVIKHRPLHDRLTGGKCELRMGDIGSEKWNWTLSIWQAGSSVRDCETIFKSCAWTREN